MDKILYEAHLKDIEIRKTFIATQPEQNTNNYDFDIVAKDQSIVLSVATKTKQDAESLRVKLIEFLNNQ